MFYNQAISGNALEARRSESCVLLGFSGGAICRDGDKPEEHLARKPRGLPGTRLHNRLREQTQRTKVTSRTRKGLPPPPRSAVTPTLRPGGPETVSQTDCWEAPTEGLWSGFIPQGIGGPVSRSAISSASPQVSGWQGGPRLRGEAGKRGSQGEMPASPRHAGPRRQSRHTPWRRPPGKVGLTKPELPSAFLERDTGRSLAKPCGSAKASLRYVRASGTRVLRTEPPF